MKTSELINQLTKLMDEHGDLESTCICRIDWGIFVGNIHKVKYHKDGNHSLIVMGRETLDILLKEPLIYLDD